MSDRLTPVDLLNTKFRRTLRGYSAAEVDDLVQQVAADLEAVLVENARLKDRVTSLERELKGFHALESSMKDALVMAQKAADDTRSAAHAQAEAEVLGARLRAREIETDADARVAGAIRRIDELQQERVRLARDLYGKLSAHLEWLSGELRIEEREPRPARPELGKPADGRTDRPADHTGEAAENDSGPVSLTVVSSDETSCAAAQS